MTSSSSSVEKIMKDEFLLIAIVAAIVIVVVLGLVANVILAPSDGSKRASSFDVVCEPQWEECRIGRRLVPFRHRARAASAPGWGTGGGRRSWHAFDCRGYRPAPPPLANATLERWRASYSRCHSPIARLGLSLTLSPLISPPVSLRSIFLQPRRGTRHRLARKRTRSWQTHRPPTSLDPLVRAARCAAMVLLRARCGCSGVCAAARVAAAAAAAAVADAAAKLLPTTAAIAANACCEGARYVLLLRAASALLSPPARALATPLGTHSHSHTPHPLPLQRPLLAGDRRASARSRRGSTLATWAARPTEKF